MFAKLFSWMLSRLTYDQLVQLVFSNPVVVAYFKHKALLEEQERLVREQKNTVTEVLEPVVQEVTQVSIFTRMDRETYEYFEKQVSNTTVASTTTDLEAGFKLGIQHVLSKLRTGYVISSGN